MTKTGKVLNLREAPNTLSPGPIDTPIIEGQFGGSKEQADAMKKQFAQMVPLGQLKVGVHSLGYVAEDFATAADDFFPGYAESFTKIGKERGWPPMTRGHFNAQLGPTGALLVGDPETVVEKIVQVNHALGGISRLTFQMSVAALPHAKMLRAIELLGTRVAPMVRTALASSDRQPALPATSNRAA